MGIRANYRLDNTWILEIIHKIFVNHIRAFGFSKEQSIFNFISKKIFPVTDSDGDEDSPNKPSNNVYFPLNIPNSKLKNAKIH